MKLANKTAIVTGAAGGLGQAFCLALAAEGARIVAADIKSCSETVAKVVAVGGEALALRVDVADAAGTKQMAAQAVEQFGSVDILINNAAVLASLTDTPFDEIEEAEWDQVMAVNVKGMWQCAKAVVPLMKQQGGGKIIREPLNNSLIPLAFRAFVDQGGFVQ